MSAATRRRPSVLAPEALERFRQDGYVRVKAAFPPELALEMQAEIWREIAEHGIRREDPGTWRTLPHGPRRAKTLALNERLASERFTGAICDLLGRDDWKRPASWGGFLVSFPEGGRAAPWDVPTETWHWDGAPDGKGLLVFSHYGVVAPRGGGTLLLSGSHRLIRRYYDSLAPDERNRPHRAHRKAFHRSHPWIEALVGRSREPVADRIATFMEQGTEIHGVPCKVVELTGDPGDAVFCDLHVLHCTSRNLLDAPRFMRTKFLFLE